MTCVRRYDSEVEEFKTSIQDEQSNFSCGSASILLVPIRSPVTAVEWKPTLASASPAKTAAASFAVQTAGAGVPPATLVITSHHSFSKSI